MSNHVSFGANFTWSHALDFGENNTTGASATALLDPKNIGLDYGNSNQNVPYRLLIYTVADSPWHVHGPLGYVLNDFELAPTFQTQSGLPYSVGYQRIIGEALSHRIDDAAVDHHHRLVQRHRRRKPDPRIQSQQLPVPEDLGTLICAPPRRSSSTSITAWSSSLRLSTLPTIRT